MASPTTVAWPRKNGFAVSGGDKLHQQLEQACKFAIHCLSINPKKSPSFCSCWSSSCRCCVFLPTAAENGSIANDDYDYVVNGNLIKDQNKGIASISYNILNLPEQIVVANKGSISYTYDAAGNKLSKTVNETGQAAKATLYLGGMIFENNVLQHVATEEGRVRLASGQWRYDYFLKDHLGNVRVMLADNGDPLEETHYYPFGLTQRGISTQASGAIVNRYKFGGKELQSGEFSNGSGLEQYDFGARYYDQQIGRWNSIDPLTEKSSGLTPYRYGFNNPIRFLDPNGAYETDGHFWTVYLMATLMNSKSAFNIAYFTELPDHIMLQNGDPLRESLLGTWADPTYQDRFHALTGGNSNEERRFSSIMAMRSSRSDVLGGWLHRLGDSYAHSRLGNEDVMYGGLPWGYLGHVREMAADLISERPGLYMSYVNNLASVLGNVLGHKSGVDLFTFNYVAESGGNTEQNSAIFETEIRLREGAKTFSVVGDQTRNINQYIGQRNAHFGSKVTAKSAYTDVDVYTKNNKGEWIKTKTEKRTLVNFE